MSHGVQNPGFRRIIEALKAQVAAGKPCGKLRIDPETEMSMREASAVDMGKDVAYLIAVHGTRWFDTLYGLPIEWEAARTEVVAS